jgi:hypothetical protein
MTSPPQDYPATRFPLTASASGKFAADGTLTVKVTPPQFELWEINLSGTFTDDPADATVIPEADLYQGVVAPTAWRGGTYSGNKDQSTAHIFLQRNEPLYCVWTGGTAGRTGTLAVSGWIWR